MCSAGYGAGGLDGINIYHLGVGQTRGGVDDRKRKLGDNSS
jgi:hypothetical protein